MCTRVLDSALRCMRKDAAKTIKGKSAKRGKPIKILSSVVFQ